MPQLEARIKSFLTRYIAEPAFVITPLMHVFVGGEVRSPMTVSAPPGTTVDQAVLLAGGGTSFSKMDSVILIRDRRHSVLDLATEGGMAGATAVHSGDQLLVPRTKESRSFVRDVLVPTATILGVVTGIANLVVTLNRR